MASIPGRRNQLSYFKAFKFLYCTIASLVEEELSYTLCLATPYLKEGGVHCGEEGWSRNKVGPAGATLDF